MASTLVIGADGQLGTAFSRALGSRAVPLRRKDLDLAHVGEIPRVLSRVDPTSVINCAAFTDVERAEEQEDLATIVNGRAVGALASWCADHSRQLVTFSSDYVFDGLAGTPYVESSPTNPTNAYGRSKLVGEEVALSHGALVVRTSWLVSGTHPSFISKTIQAARLGKVSVVDDQFGCPTIADDLVRACLDAMSAGVTGLLHVSNQGQTTWYRLAVAATGLAGIPARRVRPKLTSEDLEKARRPAFSVLRSERLAALHIDELPPWRESLPAVVEEIVGWA